MPDQIAPDYGSGAPNPPGTMDIDTLPRSQRSIDGIEDAHHLDRSRHIPIVDGQPVVRGETRSLCNASHEMGAVGYALVVFGQIHKGGYPDGQEPAHALVHRWFGFAHANRVRSGQQSAVLHPV